MKKYFLILFSALFLSCGSFKNVPNNLQAIHANNVDKLNGTYSIFAKGELQTEYPYFHNANEKFYRKYGRGSSDTLKFDTISGGKFRMKILSSDSLKIEFIKDSTVLRSQNLKYKFKEDGFLYIKNRNTIVKGVPYLFGGVDVKKVRVTLNKDDDLAINDVFDSSSAILLIFGDAKGWEALNTYERIEYKL